MKWLSVSLLGLLKVELRSCHLVSAMKYNNYLSEIFCIIMYLIKTEKIISVYSVSPICILRLRRCWIFSAAAAQKKSTTLIGRPKNGPPINGMDQAFLDKEGDMNTVNNRIYRITAHNFI